MAPLTGARRFDANIYITCHNRPQKTCPAYSGELTPPGCILLDWLGFSRPNRDFSTGCAPRSRETIFPRARQGAEGRSTVFARERLGLVIAGRLN